MKKMKGVVAAAMESSSPYGSAAAVFEDPRIRFKHQSLMQDYEELYKETEAKKKKLQMMRQKKLTIMAEVRFLRRRYKFLTQSQSQNTPGERNFVQPQNIIPASKHARKERYYSGNDVLQSPVPRFDLNQKGKTYNEREAVLQVPAAIFDLNQKKKIYIGKEAALRNLANIPDLNLKERIYSGKEAAARSNPPIFDLNQISREEEELQANGDVFRTEEPKTSSMRGGSDEQHNDMKLSCRNVGNGSSRAGKRKISWQDQLALRV